MLFYSLYALAGFIAGVFVLYNLNIVQLTVLVAVFAGIVILLCAVKRLRGAVLSVLVFAIASAGGFLDMRENNQTSCFTGEYVTVTGRISELPYKSNDVWCYVLDCEKLDFSGNVSDFKSRITAYSENEYKLDDTLDISGFLELHSTERNPGCFNAYTYYKSLGIDYKITSEEDCISKTSYKSNSFYANAVRIRSKICESIDRQFDSDNSGLIKYILTGFKKELDHEYSNRLMMSGVFRCLYSSYFHLILILVLIGLIFRRVPTQVRRLAICVLCIIYLCANPYLLTARKLFMFTVICEILRAKGGIFRSIDVLWTTILLCAVQNPFVLYNEGFIMSCAATLFIIVFYRKIYCRISWINTHKQAVNVVVMFFISAILMMPIGAFLFDGISMYSVIISVILLPVISTIYIISPIMLVESLGFCGIATIITDNLVTFIRNIPMLIEKLPFSYLMLLKPPFVLLVGYLFFLGAVYKRKEKRAFTVLLSAAVGFFASFGVLEVCRYNEATITFLSTAQGDCTITDIPYKCTIMVDGGGSAEYNTSYDVGARDVFPYLRNSNITTIDYVFVSHYHKDHADGIISLMDMVKIKNIFLPDCLPESEYRVIIEEKAKKLGIKLDYIREPQIIELDGEAVAEIIYFDAQAKEENDTSVVMRISCNDFSCLYTGDITKVSEEKILESGTDLSADILKVAHHGSATSSSVEFLEVVSPKAAVAMMSKNNTYGFPSKQTVENFKSLNISLITTADEGCVQFKEDAGRLIWQKKTR